MYEHIALGYRSSLALCLTKVRAVDIQIMSEHDQTFGPKLLIGHSDLFSRFSDFALYLGTQLVYDRVQEGKDQKKAQSEKDSHSKNPRWEKTKLIIRYLYDENIVSRMSSYTSFLSLYVGL